MSSDTTKIRPVFDASAHEYRSPSLNDCLEKGENLLELIPDVLTRFRLYKIGVTADIKKAFCQISVKPEDRKFCRFLWWEQPEFFKADEVNDSNLKTFQHCRVPFGLKPSPFLLGATINHHLDSVSNEFRTTAQQLKKSFYVDNCVISLPNENTCNKFIEECKTIMNTAKFDLRGWIWNGSCCTDENVPVLGLNWNLKEDKLNCMVTIPEEKKLQVTKRIILSAAHSIYDPIGFTCPTTLIPKLLLQQIWKLKTGWDDELPAQITKEFKEWISTINILNDIKIPRCLFKEDCKKENWSLHVFTDASIKAYAACVFLRGEENDKITLQLIAAKTRVKPNKEIFIPRMELLGCLIGSRLAVAVKQSIEFPEIPTIYWTDSSNALYWIRHETEWSIFVMNRVREIRLSSGERNWRHVPGKMNPADLPSRGCSAKNLLLSAWWDGPQWLRKTEDFWPKSKIQIDEDIINSERKRTNNNLVSLDVRNKFSDLLLNTRYENNYNKILRIVSWMLRFVYNCRNTGNRKTGIVAAEEIEEAELSVIRIIQIESFNQDSSLLKSIRTFKDEFGVIRVKTKITRRNDLFTFKYPAVLSPSHSIVKLLISSEHNRLSHPGIQIMMCVLREKYWIIHSRQTIRKIIRQCVKCRKFDSRNLQSEPSPLPLNRVRDANVFEVTGIDLAGPLYLKNKKKVWICLFTCAVFRAIHLELVSSLSTDCFVLALRRFISRRGRPSYIYSDNGTNFVGTNNVLAALDWDVIAKFSNIQKIKWIFNPPSAAWWGGFWERLIRMVKDNLRKVIGKACLNSEEMLTFLCETESLINNRPLTYLSEDVDDLSPLTPAMFLSEIRQFGCPDLEALNGDKLNKRYKYRLKIREDFRQRFRQEYLALLLQPRGQTNIKTIKTGEIVLVGNDVDKRINWMLARVLEVIPGSDGVIRVVRLQTQNGEIVRPVQRIYPLEVSVDEQKDLAAEIKTPATTRSGRKVIPPKRFT